MSCICFENGTYRAHQSFAPCSVCKKLTDCSISTGRAYIGCDMTSQSTISLALHLCKKCLIYISDPDISGEKLLEIQTKFHNAQVASGQVDKPICILDREARIARREKNIARNEKSIMRIELRSNRDKIRTHIQTLMKKNKMFNEIVFGMKFPMPKYIESDDELIARYTEEIKLYQYANHVYSSFCEPLYASR
jgi:hypothetical protein